jgi:ABC-type multidrug transport system fused ATPase/permease subunit
LARRDHGAFIDEEFRDAPGKLALSAHRSVAGLAAQTASECAPMIGGDDAIARLNNVTHRYGKIAALDSVTLALPAGCTVGLIGPDGVGSPRA